LQNDRAVQAAMLDIDAGPPVREYDQRDPFVEVSARRIAVQQLIAGGEIRLGRVVFQGDRKQGRLDLFHQGGRAGIGPQLLAPVSRAIVVRWPMLKAMSAAVGLAARMSASAAASSSSECANPSLPITSALNKCPLW